MVIRKYFYLENWFLYERNVFLLCLYLKSSLSKNKEHEIFDCHALQESYKI